MKACIKLIDIDNEPLCNQTSFFCQARGWVGVGEGVTTKMAELPYMQAFNGCSIFKRSAHLMWTGFQLFTSSAITIPCVMICSSALLNLENHIIQGFQTPAIAINQNPY